MASINVRGDYLFFDFRYRGQRCREQTKLKDTPQNRKTMQRVLAKIEAEITLGTFNYATYFPGSTNAKKFVDSAPSTAPVRPGHSTPRFAGFANTWYDENEVGWRSSHAATVRSTLDRHLIPCFGDQDIAQIAKADVLAFRSRLAKIKGRNGNDALSPKTINRIIQILGQILEEAADRFDIGNPVSKVKRLKQQRADIYPFTLQEVTALIDRIRSDYKNYLTTRFFTGMRTGEIHGLKWKYVDFERRQILVRETIVRGAVDYTKTDYSQREIDMSGPVLQALLRQRDATFGHSEFVFCTRSGLPIDVDNFTNRIWYPLLRNLLLEKRRPYQTRHTAATLWLAAGENPEWIARQMGHMDTTMLFRVYSRYVPNLTRRDGSAFESLVRGALPEEVSRDE